LIATKKTRAEVMAMSTAATMMAMMMAATMNSIAATAPHDHVSAFPFLSLIHGHAAKKPRECRVLSVSIV
jgi:hypothetical protein